VASSPAGPPTATDRLSIPKVNARERRAKGLFLASNNKPPHFVLFPQELWRIVDYIYRKGMDEVRVDGFLDLTPGLTQLIDCVVVVAVVERAVLAIGHPERDGAAARTARLWTLVR